MTDKPMIIICGAVHVDAADRDPYVEAHQDLLRRARAFAGCIHVAITADPVVPTRINNCEVWRDADALDAWRAVADAPRTDAELRDMTVRRYDATDGGPLF